MSTSPRSQDDLAAHSVAAQATFRDRHSFTGCNLSAGTAQHSFSTASCEREPQPSSNSSTKVSESGSSTESSESIDLTSDDERAETEEIDLTTSDEEAKLNLALCNVYPPSSLRLPASNNTEDSRSVSSNSEASVISLNTMAEATFGVPAPFNLAENLPPYDIAFTPNQHSGNSNGFFDFSTVDLTSDTSESDPEINAESHASLISPNAAGRSRTTTVSPFNFLPSAFEDREDETPMPRILPKFEKRSFVNSVDLDSSSEDDREDVITKEELKTWLQSQNDRYRSALPGSPSRIYRPVPRNTPIEHPFRILETYTHNSTILRPGVNVELQDKAFIRETDRNGARNEPHNYFMRIVSIIEDSRTRAVSLRGWVFHRAQYLNGVLEKKRNELCWVMHVDEDDEREIKIQAMETVSVNRTVRRRKIRLTNQPWPKLSYREDAHILEDSEETIRNERVLVCRFMYICYYVCAERREANSWSERILQRLRNGDCDKWSNQEGEPCAMEDAELRKAWRGDTVAGGAFDLNEQEKPWNERLVEVARKNIVDLTEEIVKQDPEDGDQVLALDDIEQSCRITNISTRIDWTTKHGTDFYTISSFTPSKRRAETTPRFEPIKRSRKERFALKTERPPETTSMLKRKISAFKDPFNDRLSQGKFSNQLIAESSSDEPGSEEQRPTPVQERQYTFGDSFCGAGGMSRAAHQTGLHIKYAFDCNKHACSSYAMNFPRASLHCLWANDFIALNGDRKVDIAHLSPPCQFFSDAHTIAGKDDEMNTASLFAAGEILKKSRPRVVTLEQTFGIVLRARHQGYLNALIQVFTCHGFSIRWRLLHCADYGLPQMRLRTFIIASCPGEPLPPFPKPTHSSSPSSTTNLLPWTTINSTIASIPQGAPNHEPDKCKPRDEFPRRGDKIAKTITCNGGGQIHPSGTRDFTIREFAALQGFPVEHVFGQVGAKKQIGNAVPPVVGRKVLESVVKALRKEDGI